MPTKPRTILVWGSFCNHETVGNAVPGVPTAEGGSLVHLRAYARRNAEDGVPYR